MHTVVYPHNLHELKNDTVYFPEVRSQWYCEWLIGACYFIVKHSYIWNFVIVCSSSRHSKPVWLYFFLGTLKGIFSHAVTVK